MGLTEKSDQISLVAFFFIQRAGETPARFLYDHTHEKIGPDRLTVVRLVPTGFSSALSSLGADSLVAVFGLGLALSGRLISFGLVVLSLDIA